ncbi:DUF3343 domain-containing protein [uncultured Mailhella sp.]|uniref:DUF3343 domain-containing protein n=1 Tax=uncultured Mailhella sp. TaxID=1981031 RepID=UPI0025CF42A0|nr:DUF3343 domain-containing protein [uncultured Mailhella sp.]
MLGKLTGWLKRRNGREAEDSSAVEKGFLVFQHTGEVIRAERCLQAAGFSVEVKGPPPELRSGCDMVVTFPLIMESAVRRVLEKERLSPLNVVPVSGPLLEPVSLYRTKDYGNWFMVQAANVKITVERASGRIVNVSGGGCPDVPYLASILVGESIAGAQEPRVQGHTLCSYALQKAFLEARRLWREGGES